MRSGTRKSDKATNVADLINAVYKSKSRTLVSEDELCSEHRMQRAREKTTSWYSVREWEAVAT